MRYHVALKTVLEVIHMSEFMQKVQVTNSEEQSWGTKAPKKESRALHCPSFIAAVIRRGRSFQGRRKGRRSRDADNPCVALYSHSIEIGIASSLFSLYIRQLSQCPEIPSSASSGSRARASPARSIR